MTRRRGYVELWHCDPAAPATDRKCLAVPCHGHAVSRDQLLIAKVVAYLDGVDWDTVYRSELRDRLRKAWRILLAIRRGEQAHR